MKKSIINVAVAALILAFAASALASCEIVDMEGKDTGSDTAVTSVADTAETTDAESANTSDDSIVSDSDIADTTAADTTIADTTSADTTAPDTTGDTTSSVTIDDVMAHIGVITVKGSSLAYYTEVTYTEGSDYTIYVYTELTGSVVRRVYEYLASDEAFEEFKADNILNAKKYSWQYEDDYRLVLVDSQVGFMFNPQTEFDAVVNDSANHVYYGKSAD